MMLSCFSSISFVYVRVHWCSVCWMVGIITTGQGDRTTKTMLGENQRQMVNQRCPYQWQMPNVKDERWQEFMWTTTMFRHWWWWWWEKGKKQIEIVILFDNDVLDDGNQASTDAKGLRLSARKSDADATESIKKTDQTIGNIRSGHNKRFFVHSGFFVLLLLIRQIVRTIER